MKKGQWLLYLRDNYSYYRAMQKVKNAYHFTDLDQVSVVIALLILILSTLALIVNYTNSNYAFINYFPPHAASVFLLLVLITLGALIALGKSAKITQAFFYVCQFYLILSLIAYLTIAAQVTPFPLIDKTLLRLDNLIGFNTITLLNIVAAHPVIYRLLLKAYEFIVPELAFLPCILAALQQFASLKRLYFMLLITSLLGFTFYYFWPSAAPASVLASPHFLAAQKATFLKFNQLHSYLPITTKEGGMVAMPSFHIIWAWLCQDSVWDYPLAWWLLLPLNMLMIFACIALGWHYFVDFVGSFIIIGLGYWFMRWIESSTSS